MADFDLGFTDVLGFVDLGLDIYAGVQTIQSAREVEKIQKRELQRQAAIESARAKREARVRKAQLLAAQGTAGATLSTTEAGVFGIESSLQAGLLDLETQTAAQIEQFSIQASQTATQAAVDTFAQLGTFATTDTGKKAIDFTSGLFENMAIPDEDILPASISADFTVV